MDELLEEIESKCNSIALFKTTEESYNWAENIVETVWAVVAEYEYSDGTSALWKTPREALLALKEKLFTNQ